jgi:hypothetical protein
MHLVRKWHFPDPKCAPRGRANQVHEDQIRLLWQAAHAQEHKQRDGPLHSSGSPPCCYVRTLTSAAIARIIIAGLILIVTTTRICLRMEMPPGRGAPQTPRGCGVGPRRTKKLRRSRDNRPADWRSRTASGGPMWPRWVESVSASHGNA